MALLLLTPITEIHFCFLQMEKNTTGNSLLFGLSTSSLATFQFIFHPAATMLPLKLKPADTAAIHDFEGKGRPFNLVFQPVVDLLHVFAASWSVSHVSDRGALRQQRDLESGLPPVVNGCQCWTLVPGSLRELAPCRADV